MHFSLLINSTLLHDLVSVKIIDEPYTALENILHEYNYIPPFNRFSQTMIYICCLLVEQEEISPLQCIWQLVFHPHKTILLDMKVWT